MVVCSGAAAEPSAETPHVVDVHSTNPPGEASCKLSVSFASRVAALHRVPCAYRRRRGGRASQARHGMGTERRLGGGMEKRTLALAIAILAPTQLQSTPKDTSANEPASMNCRVRAMQTSCSERTVTRRVAGHRAAPQRLPRPAAADRAFSSSKFRLSRLVWRSASDLVGRSVLGRHQANRRVHRWRLACAIPEDQGQHHKQPGKHSSSRATTPTASIVGSRSGS